MKEGEWKKKYNFTAFCGDPMNNSTKSSNSGGKLRLERGTYRALCVVLWGSQRRCDEDKQSSSGVRRAFPVLFCPPWPMFFHRTHFRAFPQFPVGISCHHEADSVVQTVWCRQCGLDPQTLPLWLGPWKQCGLFTPPFLPPDIASFMVPKNMNYNSLVRCGR